MARMVTVRAVVEKRWWFDAAYHLAYLPLALGLLPGAKTLNWLSRHGFRLRIVEVPADTFSWKIAN